MVRVSFPTEKHVPLPLLVDASQLQRIDTIIDEYLDKLRLEKEQQLEAAIDAELAEDIGRGYIKQEKAAESRVFLKERLPRRRQWADEKRSVTVFLSRGRQLEVERFAEALSHLPSQDEQPLGIRFHLRMGPIDVRVDLNGPRSSVLLIDVEPNDWNVTQELFGALVNWANDVEAPRWQQKWFEFRWLYVLLLWALVFIGAVLIPLSIPGEATKYTNKQEARKLLAQGISASNERRALELLLAIEAEYSPPGAQASLGVRYWTYVFLGAIALLVALICPK